VIKKLIKIDYVEWLQGCQWAQVNKWTGSRKMKAKNTHCSIKKLHKEKKVDAAFVGEG
jgi:hypothetical protein